jgi:ZIP family zinc transporter
MDLFLFIILVTVIGPLVGSLIGVMRKPSNRMMYNMLAFAGGVMLSVSFLELIPESIQISNIWIAIAGIISGSVLMYAVEKLIPHIRPELATKEVGSNKLKKTALFLFMGIFIHNFPEGMAIAIGAVSGLEVSLVIAIAIAVHDIPEAICTSSPYYYVTRKRLKAFLISASTAIPTILGFVLAFYLYQFIPTDAIAFLIAATAGLMIFITGHEIIPCSCFRSSNHCTIFSFMFGIVFVILLGLI